MSGFLSSVKGAFFEEDDVPTPSAPTDKSPIKAPPTTAVYSPAPKANVATGNSDKMKQSLLDELNSHMSDSPYAKFQKMNSALKTKITDTTTRLIAISTSLDIQGITRQHILESANGAVSFLNAESLNFRAEIENNISNLDNNFKDNSLKIAASIEEKQNQIKTLSEEISALQKDKSTSDIETQTAKTKFEVYKIEFNGSLESILKEINTDINDITAYLGV